MEALQSGARQALVQALVQAFSEGTQCYVYCFLLTNHNRAANSVSQKPENDRNQQVILDLAWDPMYSLYL
jgi:hypothetical protein